SHDTSASYSDPLALHDALPILTTQHGVVQTIRKLARIRYHACVCGPCPKLRTAQIKRRKTLCNFRTLSSSMEPARHSAAAAAARSEEHTSELQSRENLVCRLLL